MDCTDFEAISQLYIDGGGDAERVAEFQAHLLACDRCKREMEYLQATIRGIVSYPQLEVREGLADDVMAQLKEKNAQWDFSHELEYITGGLSQISSGQSRRYPGAFAPMIIGLILLPSRIYLRICGIAIRRIHAVLMPPLVRWIHRARIQINHSIMNSLTR